MTKLNIRKFLVPLIFLGISMVNIVDAAKPRAEAIFAAGCFWCIEEAFSNMNGIIDTEVGFIGGHVANPTYDQVSNKNTGHREAIRIVYDPAKVDYKTLLKRFWQNVDATDAGGQFCDRGESYKSAIYYKNNTQKKLAVASKNKITKSNILNKNVVTDIIKAGKFYKAEGYHQKYHRKNPIRYKYYKFRCGRAARLQELWGKVNAEFWSKL